VCRGCHLYRYTPEIRLMDGTMRAPLHRCFANKHQCNWYAEMFETKGVPHECFLTLEHTVLFEGKEVSDGVPTEA
jgi:hypothetical protein